MPLSGVKSLFTLMGRLGWGTLLVLFVVGLVSSSNSVGVALPQPRVEVRSASTLGIGTKRVATL